MVQLPNSQQWQEKCSMEPTVVKMQEVDIKASKTFPIVSRATWTYTCHHLYYSHLHHLDLPMLQLLSQTYLRLSGSSYTCHISNGGHRSEISNSCHQRIPWHCQVRFYRCWPRFFQIGPSASKSNQSLWAVNGKHNSTYAIWKKLQQLQYCTCMYVYIYVCVCKYENIQCMYIYILRATTCIQCYAVTNHCIPLHS